MSHPAGSRPRRQPERGQGISASLTAYEFFLGLFLWFFLQLFPYAGPLAQLVEHRTFNPRRVRSSRTRPTRVARRLRRAPRSPAFLGASDIKRHPNLSLRPRKRPATLTAPVVRQPVEIIAG